MLQLLVTFVLIGVWGTRHAVAQARGQETNTPRRVVLLDADWRFTKSDPNGAQLPSFDASTWRTVTVPHDWSIEGPFDAQNATGGAGAFLPGGVGWYRKGFVLPLADKARHVSVELDGVMANSDVWINGYHLGRRPSGYVSLRYELTGHLRFGPNADNVLAVRADNFQQPASRWYAGAGIYRHVRLVITESIHIVPRETVVITQTVSDSQATVRVRTLVTNEDATTSPPLSFRFRLVGPNNQTVASSEAPSQPILAGKSVEIVQVLPVARPMRWDVDHPHLYRAVVRLQSGAHILDELSIPFGIREARFEAVTGFYLNGRNLKIKGVCLHQDGGAFGTAVPIAVWKQRLQALKTIGVNAIRTAHNPFSPDFLDLCDRMGFLVVDEMFDAWMVGKEPYDYHLYFRDWSRADVRDSVMRDRNHPSVILWSVGNEIRDTPNAPLAKETLSGLVAACHEFDPTRPVTQALFRPNQSHDYDNGLADLLDVVGQNYRENELAAAHRQKPARKIIGTENGHDRRAWLAVRDNPAFSGQFLWTGIDYLGESRNWPVVGASSGLLDRTGQPRPVAFERQSWWSDSPMVYAVRRIARTTLTPTDPGFEANGQNVLRRPLVLFADWNPRKLEPHEETVEVYSNCSQVELFLNGKSLGVQRLPTDAMPRVWKVPYARGVLRAVGSNKGKTVAVHELKTAGAPARLALASDEGVDGLHRIRAVVFDANGVPVPDAATSITFAVTSGVARVVAVDNADMTSHEPFQASRVKTYQGQCVAWVQQTGEKGPVTLIATASGLSSAVLVLKSAMGN